MLELKNISKSFDGKQVLKDINLQVNKGDIVSILGPSGCGKTTLLNIILGIDQASSGEIYLNEQEITKLPPIKRNFTIAFQNYALFPHLNTYDNIIFGLKNRDTDNLDAVDEVIKLMELEKHIHKKISELSGGQKQRVSLARALVVKPNLLLLDEPLSALDGLIKEKVKRLILDSAKKLGLTIIIVTHDPEEALTMSNKIVVLNEGSIIQCDTPQNIVKMPKSIFIDEFINNLLFLKHQNIERVLKI